jgi:ADP-ribosylglycohydrolase
MLGAILGDIVGSPYEFDMGDKIKDFGPLFIAESIFTDDSVMTIAVAEALMNAGLDADTENIKKEVIKSMQSWGRRYPHAGYGARFIGWLASDNPAPYGSFGNGSAMRVSAVGWLYDSIERTREVARATAEVSHNHPEGIKGAEATASAIYLARNGKSKDEIKEYIIKEFAYDFSRTLDEIRPRYHHVESCQETVPEALTAFFEGNDFEDVVRNAVSLGGDCDTLTCIASGIAEAFYGIPDEYRDNTLSLIEDDMRHVLDKFWQILRIKNMEHLFDQKTNLKTLAEYYESLLWRKDFEDDEAGLLPSGLKKGVLSEDGIYNLLQANEEE